MAKKVAILGGGVAGLTAAHELVRCGGFDVDVYELATAPGGKAASNVKPQSGTGGRHPLPGEHGFRFFPGFYQHVPDTMKRIPFPGNANGVLDNLVSVPLGGIAQEGKPLYTFPTAVPSRIDQWRQIFENWSDQAELGLAPGEATYFIGRLLTFMTTCDKRRFAELESISWWDYTDAANRSPQYRKLLAGGLTRSLVAMRAEEANTRTMASILVQMIMSMTRQGTMNRVLNAATSDAWIKPWVALLMSNRVNFSCETEVQSLQSDGTKITGVTVKRPNGTVDRIQADYYIAAFPVEVAQRLLVPLAPAAPSLGRIRHLRCEWMNGIQLYLRRDMPICPGQIICADSAWALTCISQPQFWRGVDLGRYGDGSVKGLISIDISDWTKPGTKVTNKRADQCNENEIVQEVVEQLRAHLTGTSDPLDPADLSSWFLDPSITFPGQATPVANSQPLLVNTAGSWVNRPEARTELPNLFLASDYVRTNADLACMEGANEAGRRAVNALIAASGSNARRCKVWGFSEPTIFLPLKKVDEILFEMGSGHPGIDRIASLKAAVLARSERRRRLARQPAGGPS
ncbi:NAD-binding domain and a Fe-S cluster-containing protein [Rhodospirillales bacterium URHD0017]|nr:NAD-binding domain and a Fe-S cluster-containing protein [Rhodospirillales bacterium URHD0017]